MAFRWLWLMVGILVLMGCTGLPVQRLPFGSTPTPEVVRGATEPRPIAGSETITPTGIIVPTPDRAMEGSRRVAARVNGQPIYLDTYQRQVNQLEQVLQEPEFGPADDTKLTKLADLQRQVLEGLIDQLIIEQQAAALNLTVTDEQLEAKFQESIARQQGQANFEGWLAENSLTLDSFEESLRAQLIANQLFEQVTAGVPETAEQIQLQFIRVTTADTARILIEQLKTGASFSALAQDKSLDTTMVDPEWLPKGTGLLPFQVEETAFSLEPGQINGPIETDRGFYIIKLSDRENERPLKTEVRQILKQRVFLDWLSEQRSTAVIEVFVPG
jgi:parvulin-like peptidyl-prolyl isomerase